MNDACTFEAAEAVLRDHSPAEGVLSFLASRSKRSVRELSEPIGEVFRGASAALEQMSMSLIEKRTAVEFDAAFTDVFRKYAALTISLSRIARAVVPEDAVERMAREAICELEADFRNDATATFGSAVKEQAMFTMWTIRKTKDVVAAIYSGKLIDETRKKEDDEFSEQYTVNSLIGHLSLDCLSVALKHKRAIYPEVMARLMDGLRAMVNAYTWARRGLALRTAQAAEPLDSELNSDADDALIHHSLLTWSELSDDNSPSNAS
jgi:hypothetical protein